MKKTSWRVFLSIILFVVMVVGFGPFYTQDGPNHKKDTLILSRLDSSPIEAKVYENGIGPLKTNTLFSILYLPLARWISTDTYERIFVIFFLVSLLIVYRYFLKTYTPANQDLWPLVLPFLFHPLYLRGFYNFLASVPLTLLALIFVHRDLENKSLKNLIPFLILCWIAFLAHPFSFFILSLSLGVNWLARWKERWRFLIPYSCVIFLFFSLGFILPLFETGMSHKTPYSFSTLPMLMGGLIGLNFMDDSPLHFILPLPFMILLGGLVIQNVRRQGITPHLLWISALIAYFIFPRSGGGSAHMNERFLPYVFFFIPVTLSINLENPWRQRILSLSLVTFFLVTGGILWGMHQVQKEAYHARAVLHHLPKISRLYPINFNVKGPSLFNWDLAHIWAEYEDDKIVFSPYLFALPQLTPLIKRLPNSENYFPATEENYPRENLVDSCYSGFLYDSVDCNLVKEQALLRILKAARHYDYWFIYQPPENFLKFLEGYTGLKLVSQSGSFSLWHYETPLPFNPLVP